MMRSERDEPPLLEISLNSQSNRLVAGGSLAPFLVQFLNSCGSHRRGSWQALYDMKVIYIYILVISLN